MHRDEKVKRVVYHPNTIFNLTKGPIVCYLSCRGVNCRDLMLANLYIGSPPRSIGGVSGISGGGGVSSGGGGGGYPWLLAGYASLLCGYGWVVPCLFLLCLCRAFFLENSISHSVQVVDIVETLLNTSNSFNCSDQDDKKCLLCYYLYSPVAISKTVATII